MPPRPAVSTDRLLKTERKDRSYPPRSGAEVITAVPDYYKLLELDRSATAREIADAYRYFAKKYHPAGHKHVDAETKEKLVSMFKACNEAYEILGNPRSRAVYDFYGGKAVRNGILHEAFDFREGAGYERQLKEKPEAYFRKFNYEKGPIPKIVKETDHIKKMLSARNDDLKYPDQPPEVVELRLTLEELYAGGVKTLQRTKKVLSPLKDLASEVREELEVKIEPGWTNGTEVLLKGSGSEFVCAHTSDLILRVVVEDHPRFRLNGHDLHATITIPLANVMDVKPVQLQHLDGRLVSINMTDLACPNVVRIIAGQGLPKNPQRTEFGDLHVTFDIIFPDEVDPYQKLELWVALVEYPRSIPPLHYSVAPVSETSLRSVQKMPVPTPFLKSDSDLS